MLKYRVLMERLRVSLNTKDLSKGRLPPLMELAKQENCSLNTVQRAVQELKKEGVLMTKTGQGTFSSAAYPFEDLDKAMKLPVRFINCCGFSMSNMLMLRDFYSSLDEVMFKEERSIHNYSLLKKNGVILPLAERDLETSVCGNFLFSPFNEELLNNLMLQCKNIISIDRDLTAMGIDSIVNDNLVGAMLVANRLIEMGHKKIAYIGTHQTVPEPNGFDPALAERFRGFKSAFLLKDLPLDEDLCVSVENRCEDGALKALDALFAKGKSFTAIVSFYNSPKEFTEYLKGKKLSVPKDISIATAGKVNDLGLMGGAVFSMRNTGQVAWEIMKRRIEKTNMGISLSSDNAELYSIPPIFELGGTIAAPKR